MRTPAAVISHDPNAALRAMIHCINTKPKIRPQPATPAKLAQLMVRANFFPDPDSWAESEVREFERALRVEREGFRPSEDSVDKRELFVCHESSREYSYTTDEGVVITRKFCAHHDSPHYGPLIVKLWNEIRVVITKTSELIKWVCPDEKDAPHGLRKLKKGVDGVLEIIETGFMNVWGEENEMNLPNAEWKLHLQTIPAHTFCPGCQMSWFCSHSPGWWIVGAITIAASLFDAKELHAWMRDIIDVRYMATCWNAGSFYYPFNPGEKYDIFGEMQRWVSHIPPESVETFLAIGGSSSLM
jgi:hypothetical protein